MLDARRLGTPTENVCEVETVPKLPSFFSKDNPGPIARGQQPLLFLLAYDIRRQKLTSTSGSLLRFCFDWDNSWSRFDTRFHTCTHGRRDDRHNISLSRSQK